MQTVASKNGVIKRNQGKISKKYEKKKIKLKLVLLTPAAAHISNEMYQTLLQT